ncbi:LTA synthase family protein [Achromobacter sp. NPDC058515]|uniref:LTA synthase family protein n=1 Tax=Achromobacter sp. NPDC058515 TaxID=3346533 RepID=UPI00365E08C4
MTEAVWAALLPPYLIGLALSFGVEAGLAPRPVAPWRRPMAAAGVHAGVWTLAFALELMLFRRPYFAVANVLAIELLIVLVSNAKHRALREPFVYPDFEYFTDAIRHPRLYLPFFGVGRALAAAAGYGLALWAGLALEAPVAAGAAAAAAGLAALGTALAAWAGRRLVVVFDAAADLKRLGLASALWAYGRQERQAADELRANAPFSPARTLSGSAPPAPDPMPDLVVIQSESFFDARRAYPSLRPEILGNFDLLKAESARHGRLHVAAWGANTVRTEFAFLSGMHGQALGIHQYNPYRRLAQGGFPTLASYLKSLGYRTICVHPYHRSFYRRDKALPLLGYDEFIGMEAFSDAPLAGPYVGDRAVGDKVASLLAERDSRPLYIHAITMENHGPLHWETVTPADAEAVLLGPMPAGCEDLVAYARHLRNADAMLGSLRTFLAGRAWPASLCVFGDHVPIMPAVYEKMGDTDGATDYLLWQSATQGAAVAQDCDVASLARTYLALNGLA